jgi:broad specificity phosphatase PhoE
MSELASSCMDYSIVIVARHGERLDYVTRDAGGNWVASSDRPFDTPLTEHGHEQGRKLGGHLTRETKRMGIPPISAIYSSPFLRCRQTAIAALHGVNAACVVSGSSEIMPPVRVENGLAESINDDWYSSWALPGANGTWGYRPPGVNRKSYVIDGETLHPLSKHRPVQSLLDWKSLLETDGGTPDDPSLLDRNYESRTSLGKPYCFHPPQLESPDDQRRRMLDAVETVTGPGKTVLVVSHSGPTIHLYEELTGNPCNMHGKSSYCCYSIYKKKLSDDANGKWEAVAVNMSNFLHENAVTESPVSDVNN